MRLALLAVSSTTLLAIGTALSVQAILPPAPHHPAIREAVVPPAPAPAVKTEANEQTAKAAAGSLSEPTAPTVVRVKTVRIEPERPLGTTEAEQAAVAAESPQQETASAGEQPAISPVRDRAAALKAVTPEAESVEASPAPRARTTRAKPPVVAARRTSHRQRKQEQVAGDDVAKDTLSYAPKEKGPESLNPLGKLLSGR